MLSPPGAQANSASRAHFKAPEGRYELACERAHGLVPFSPSRTTRLTLATPGCSPAVEAAAAEGRDDDDENDASSPPPRPLHRGPKDEFLLFNVGEALNVAPLLQIDRNPLRSLVFDGRGKNDASSFVPPSTSSHLRATTPVCHSWRPLAPALRGREPDVLVGLDGGAVVALSLELELNEAAAEEEEARRRRGGGGEANDFCFPASSLSSPSSPVAAQVLWPPAEVSPATGGDGDGFAASAAVSPSLASRVVAVAWAPGSRAVVVHACGLVAVHDPPWRLERSGGGADDEAGGDEMDEGEGGGRRAGGAFFEATAATPSPRSPASAGDARDVEASSPASSSFMTAVGGERPREEGGASPPAEGGGATYLTAEAAAHATTPPTPPTPPSRRQSESQRQQQQQQQKRRPPSRPAPRTFCVVSDLDEGPSRKKKGSKNKSSVPRSSIVSAAALSPDGTMLATAGRDGVARVHSLETGTLVAGFSAYYGALHAVAWSPDGGAIAAGGEDDCAAVFALGELRCGLAWASGAESWVSALAFDPRGASASPSPSTPSSRSYRLAVGAQDCCLGLHDVAAPDDDFAAGLAPLSPRAGTAGGGGFFGERASGVARSMFAAADDGKNDGARGGLSLRLASSARPPSPASSLSLIAPAPASSEMTFVPPVARACPAHSEPLSDVAFSSSTKSGAAIVTADAGGCVRVWARPARAAGSSRAAGAGPPRRSAPRAAPAREREGDGSGGGGGREGEERPALDLMSL